MEELKRALIACASDSMPGPGEAALSQRQRQILSEARDSLSRAEDERDPLCLAEMLRQARSAFDRLVGRTSTEDVLDALFSRFCIGK